jgi:hypothetical protein
MPGTIGPQRSTDIDEDARTWHRPEPAAIRVSIIWPEAFGVASGDPHHFDPRVIFIECSVANELQASEKIAPTESQA